MASIVVIGEDELCCALGTRLVQHCLPDWLMPLKPIDTKGVTKLHASLARYQDLAHVHHVLCMADTDGHCAIELLRRWLPNGGPERFALRFAVNEADAWALADRAGFAEAFGVAQASMARDVESLVDAKREVLRLAARSSKRLIRDEVPSQRDPGKPGSGYNAHLCGFVRNHWRVGAAAEESQSLARAVTALQRFRVPD
jgi:hypothetical protein